MKTILQAGRNYGWLLSLVSVAAVLLLLYTKELPQAVGVPLPGDGGIVTTAREPGIDYDVQKFCADPNTRVSLGVQMEVRGTHYVLSRGNEQVDYKDTDPSGSNSNAIHYWIGPDGLQKSEPVQMTIPALECAKKKYRG